MKKFTDEEWNKLVKKYKDDPNKLRDYLRGLGYTEQEIEEIIKRIKRYLKCPIPPYVPVQFQEKHDEKQPEP